MCELCVVFVFHCFNSQSTAWERVLIVPELTAAYLYISNFTRRITVTFLPIFYLFYIFTRKITVSFYLQKQTFIIHIKYDQARIQDFPKGDAKRGVVVWMGLGATSETKWTRREDAGGAEPLCIENFCVKSSNFS